MKNTYFKLAVIIALSIFIILGLNYLFNEKKNIQLKSSLYNANVEIPIEIVNDTIFIEEIYGKVDNFIVDDNKISFNLLDSQNNIKDSIELDLNNKIERVLKMINKPIIQDDTNETADYLLEEDLQNIYYSTKEEVTLDTFLQETDTITYVYASLRYESLDSKNYVIEAIVYE